MVRVFLLEVNPSIKVKMTRAIRITIKANRGLSLKRQVKSVIKDTSKKCYYYQKDGHFIKDCYKRKR